jgi:hypothetical protein
MSAELLNFTTTCVVLLNLRFSFWIAYRLTLTLAAVAAVISHAPPVHSGSHPPFLILLGNPKQLSSGDVVGMEAIFGHWFSVVLGSEYFRFLSYDFSGQILQ